MSEALEIRRDPIALRSDGVEMTIRAGNLEISIRSARGLLGRPQYEGGTMASFEDKLKGLVKTADEDKATRENAARMKEQDRLEFLRTFRDVAHNVIRPVLKRASQAVAGSSSVQVDTEFDDERVIFRAGRRQFSEPRGLSGYTEPPSLPYTLQYRADFPRGRVITSGSGVTESAKTVDDIDEAFVQLTIEGFMEYVVSAVAKP